MLSTWRIAVKGESKMTFAWFPPCLAHLSHDSSSQTSSFFYSARTTCGLKPCCSTCAIYLLCDFSFFFSSPLLLHQQLNRCGCHHKEHKFHCKKKKKMTCFHTKAFHMVEKDLLGTFKSLNKWMISCLCR